MRKVALLFFAIAALSFVLSQETEQAFFNFDSPITVRVQHFRKNEIDLSASCYIESTEYAGEVYSDYPDLLPITYPSCSGALLNSTSSGGYDLLINPEVELAAGLYLIKVWDFDIDGNGFVDPGEWIDANGNGAIDSGEWTDGGILYLRMYKRTAGGVYKEIDYDYYIKPTMPPHVVYYPKSYDHLVSGTAPAYGVLLRPFVIPSRYYDLDHDGFYDGGEPIANDLNGNGYFDLGDVTLTPTAPPANALLTIFNSFEKYYDANTNTVYDAGEPIIQDFDFSGTYTDMFHGYKLIALHFKECAACADYVGDVAYYEDEYIRVTLNFAGFIRETKKEKLGECEGCFKSDVTSSARLQVSVHKKFTMVFDLFDIHALEYAALPDHFVDVDMDGLPDEISNGRGLSYYYSLIDEKDVDKPTELESERDLYQVAAFDPYYIVIKNNREVYLYETDYGEALRLPHAPPQAGVAKTEVEKWGYVDYTDGSGFFTNITLFKMYGVKTQKDGEVWAAKLVFRTRARNALPEATTEEVYTSYYYVRDGYYKNDIIFPDCADFGVIVEKIDLENEKVWLKFIRKVDVTDINYDDYITFNQLGLSQINILARRDIQIVFDEFDRAFATKCCEYPIKQLNKIPKYKKVLFDVTTATRTILNTASLRYEDLKGYDTSAQYYEEQPQVVIIGTGGTGGGEGTRVSVMDILKYGAVYDTAPASPHNTIICAPGDLNCNAVSRIAAKPAYFMLKYWDANGNNTYNPGETIIVDSNLTGLYEATERVYYGTAPPIATPLTSFGWNISMPTAAQDVTYGDGYAFLDSYITYTTTARNNSGLSVIGDFVFTDDVPTNITFVRTPDTVAGLQPGDPWTPPAGCGAAPPPGEPAGCGIRYRLNAGPWQYRTNAADADEATYDTVTREVELDYGLIGALAPNTRIDIQYVVYFDPVTDIPALTGDDSLTGDSIINDSATIEYTESGIPGQSLTADSITTRIGTATISKTPAPTSVTPPGSITYTIALWQLSTTTTTTGTIGNPFIVTEPIPTGTTYNTGSCLIAPAGMGTCNDTMLPNLTWQGIPAIVPPVLVQPVATMTFTVSAPPEAVGTIRNAATLFYVALYNVVNQLSNSVSSNTAEVSLVQPHPTVSAKDPETACVTLDFQKTAPSNIVPGSTITYDITVTNTAGIDAPYSDVFNLTIVDTIPTGTSYVANSMLATINGTDIALTDVADVETPDRYYGGFYDATTKTVSLNLKNLPAGSSATLSFNVLVEDVPVNHYAVRVYVYDYYAEEKSSRIGMGGILGSDDVKITPDDTTKFMYDIIYTQVYENSNRKDRYPLKAYEQKIYDDSYYVDYRNVNETSKTADFTIARRSFPVLGVDLMTRVYDEFTFREISTEVMAEDEFILYTLIGNTGSGMAHDVEYLVDASAFSPQNLTWIHDTDNSYPMQQPALDIYGGETQTLMFLMKAPAVSHETTYPVKVKLKWRDDRGGLFTTEKVIFVNVRHERRGQIEVIKHIVEGKNKTVSEETGTEQVSLNMGERRTIHVYLRNTSDKKISGISYTEIPPKGITIVQGAREWKGSLEAGKSVDFTFTIEATQTGVFQLQARASYEQSNQIYEATSNVVQISVVGEKGPTVEKSVDASTVEKGDVVNIVIKVANDTKRSFKNIQVMEIIPKGFTVDEIQTKGFTQKEDVLTYQISDLAPGKYVLLKYTLRAGPSPGIFSFLGTRATYEDSSKVKQEITSTDTEITVNEESVPSLAAGIAIQEREPFASQEENITIIVTLVNGGGIEARDITLTLPVPDTTQLVDSSGAPVKTDKGLTYRIDYINPGDTYVIKYTFKALHTPADRVVNIAFEAKYTDEFKREYSTKTETAVTIEAKKPVVTVSRTFDKNELKVNYPFIVTTTINNEGDSQAAVVFKDELPEGFKVVTGQNTWSGTLKPGDAVTVSYEVMANKVGTFNLGDSARATYKATTGTEYTATPGEESGSQELTVQGVLVKKVVDRTDIKVGDIVVVTVDIKNTYKEKATAIMAKDTLPAGAELVEGSLEWKLEKLEPDELVTYTYSLKFIQDGDILLPAVLTSFRDIYGDAHETLSDAATVRVTYPEGAKPTLPPETTPPPTTQPPRITQIFRFQSIWIIVLVGIVLVAGMIAILFIEQRRTEREEEKERIEQLTPEQLRAELWRRGAEEQRELPPERKRPPREGLPPRAFTGEEVAEEKKPSFLDRILGRKPEAKVEEEVRAPPILKEEEKAAPKAILERISTERVRKERARDITEHRDIREVIEGRTEEMTDLERLIYGEERPKEKPEEKVPSPRDVLKEREVVREAVPPRPERIIKPAPKPEVKPEKPREEFVTPSIIEKFKKKEEVPEPLSLRDIMEEKVEPERREIKEIKRPSYLERILAREKEEVPKPAEEKPKPRLEDILKRIPEERKPAAEKKREEEEEDELPEPKDLLKKNGNGKNGEKK